MTASLKSLRTQRRWLICIMVMIASLTSLSVDVAVGATVDTTARSVTTTAATTTRAEIVRVAAAEVGSSEANGRCTKYGDCRGLEWCAMFTKWVWNTAGVDPVHTTLRAREVGLWGVNNGSFKRRPAGQMGNPLPGDIVVYGEPAAQAGGHVSIVESVHGDGTITTIDGNYGEAVTRRRINPTTTRSGADNLLISGYVAPKNVAPSTRYENLGVYRTSTSTFILRKADGSVLTQIPFGDGSKGDVPVVGHFEDSRYDNLGVYRMSTGQFIIRKSDGSVLTTVAFGDTAKGDVPVVGHFENTEYDNLAVYRKSTGQFIIRKSDGSILTTVAFGDTAKGDVPVIGHFE